MRPLGYLLTWTCSGTWLHGDERGSVDAQHNVPGTRLVRPDDLRRSAVFGRLIDAPRTLSPEEREIVEDTIRSHCAIRRWELRAVNARTNHVHVVVQCAEGVSPETALEQFKAWCTRRLRKLGLAGPTESVWTERGSTRWLNTTKSLNAAIDYVENRQ